MMNKKLSALLLTVLMLCGAAFALADGITVTDMHDREITLDAPATRIVALTPSDCEILCAIGCEDALVGRGKYCDYPESISELPVVQSGAETTLEEILALDPQVVLMSDMSQTAGCLVSLREGLLVSPAIHLQFISGGTLICPRSFLPCFS